MPVKFIVPGTLPEPFRPKSWAEVWAQQANNYINLSGETEYIISSTEPAASDRGKLWLKTDASDNYIRDFLYQGGKWIKKHPYNQNDSVLFMWTGTLAGIDDFDGGATGVVSATTGPMWAAVSEFAARIPIGVGTTESGIDLTSPGIDKGKDTHTLTIPEMPSHDHDIPLWKRYDAEADLFGIKAPQDPAAPSASEGTMQVETKGGGQAHNNLPPVRSVYFIKRTKRVYYVG